MKEGSIITLKKGMKNDGKQPKMMEKCRKLLEIDETSQSDDVYISCHQPALYIYN